MSDTEPPLSDSNRGEWIIEIQNTSSFEVDTTVLAGRMRETLNHIRGAGSGEVCVRLVNDPEICRIHQQWLDDPTPTDVISFPNAVDPGPSMEPPYLGDIAISVDTAELQSREAGIAIIDELKLLCIHGLLHLLGHEDTSPDGASAMTRLQEQFVPEAYPASGVKP